MNKIITQRINKILDESLGIKEEDKVEYEKYLGYLQRLAFMAEYKYDHYEMYIPGGRLFDHLGNWLKQFDVEYRKTAVEMLCERMVFLSQREMQELAHNLYYDCIVPNLLDLIIKKEKLEPYDFRTAFDKYFKSYLRKSLFIGLSDGARIDYFRRHHIELSQDQVIPIYRAPHDDYTDKLREETKDPNARFQQVILVDDFTASGYTLLREKDGILEGSLTRLLNEDEHSHRHKEIIEGADLVLIAYYVASQQAIEHVEELIKEIPEYAGPGKTKFVTAMCLETKDTVKQRKDEDSLNKKIRELCDKYYDETFETEGTLKGKGIRLGYGSSGLTLSMYSNTPNNSIYPLWLDRDETKNGKPFYPLFRRIDRHRTRQ